MHRHKRLDPGGLHADAATQILGTPPNATNEHGGAAAAN
jgi:hypothetical protein